MTIAAALPATRTYTADDLLALPDRKHYELVNGELKELKMSTLASFVAGELFGRLREFTRPKRLGWSFPEGTGYQCFPERTFKVRKPDVSFIKAERLTWEQAQSPGYLQIAPDLAVEVLSTHDHAIDVNAKVAEYLAAGVELVWVIDPLVRVATIYRHDGTSAYCKEHQALDGENLLPGFSVRLDELLQPPPGAATTSS